MNQEQLLGLLRDVLKVGGTIAAMVGVSATDINHWTSIILQYGGPVLTIISIVWSQMGKTKAAIVQKAVAQPEVLAITVTKPALAVAAHAADPTVIVNVQTAKK